jgi:hypothetical protein
MTAYVTLMHRDLDGVGYTRYLYSSHTVEQEPVQTPYGQIAIIQATDARQAEVLVDRARSGMIGARAHETLDHAQAYIEEWKE